MARTTAWRSATFPCRKRCGKPSFMQWMQSLRESILHAQDPARSTWGPVTCTGTSFACGSLADAARVIGIGHAAVPALCLTVAVRPQSDMPKEPLMLPIHTILHPTDFSARARSAFDLACALARDYDARLVVVHVKPPPTSRTARPRSPPWRPRPG